MVPRGGFLLACWLLLISAQADALSCTVQCVMVPPGGFLLACWLLLISAQVDALSCTVQCFMLPPGGFLLAQVDDLSCTVQCFMFPAGGFLLAQVDALSCTVQYVMFPPGGFLLACWLPTPFLTVTRKFCHNGSLVHIFGSCEHHCKPTKEMYIALKPSPKGGTLCCRLYKLGN